MGKGNVRSLGENARVPMTNTMGYSEREEKSSRRWVYSRGRRGDRNQAKCSILIPDRDDSSVHEIWAANILSHINTKVTIT